MLVINLSHAQEVPKVIPPSPEAISMVQYGNTGVNFYTGQPSFSVPIHTVSVKGYQFPISLSYNSFQGINLETTAPWVGIGWSLNATGTISRSVKGVPDDELLTGTGYLHSPEPDLNDNLKVVGYVNGATDLEPDKFYYSVNGVSGSFYFDRGGNIIQKPKTNVEINYVNSSPISKFTIKDTNGLIYIFDVLEKTKSVPWGAAPVDEPDAVTSWYLSAIQDQNGGELLSFNYYDLPNLKHTIYAPQSLKESTVLFNEATDMKFTDQTTTGKRIKEIVYPGGKVKFQKSTDSRQDFINDKYLEGIEILDGDGNRIKKYVLSYSYFDKDSVTPIDASPVTTTFKGFNVGDYYKRLRLDSLQEWDKDSLQAIPAFKFDYNDEYQLPHRYSYAKDHWGFYNGQDSNNSPEPKYNYKYWVTVIPGFEYKLAKLGSADREASPEYAKTGVLKRVTYPSGGSTEFEMEGNTVVSDALPNQINQSGPIGVPLNSSRVDFNTNLIREPFFSVRISGFTPQACAVNGWIYKSGTDSLINAFTVPYNSGELFSHDTTMFIAESGAFYVKMEYQSQCSYQNATDKLEILFDTEVALAEKIVGGLRVKSITDHDGIDTNKDVTRYFHYGEGGSSGLSTGRLVTVPQYAFQRIQNIRISIGNWQLIPVGVMRNFSPTYPLMSTNGSFVGYGKVTVINGDEQVTGKTEYQFTTSDDYPNFFDGYFDTPLTGQAYFDLGEAGTHETYPLAHVDDRDYMRGLMTRQTQYSWNGTHFEKASETENEYTFTYLTPLENGDGETVSSPPLDNDVSFNTPYAGVNTSYDYASGLKLVGDTLAFDIKYYNIYSGRIDLEKSVNRQYAVNDTTQFVESISTNYWNGLSIGDGYYNVSRTTVVDSEGDTLETRYSFPYDSLAWFDPVIRDSLISKNMLSTIMGQESYESGTLLGSLRNIFNTGVHTYRPSEVRTAKGANPLETRVRYHKYDVDGNPIEVSQEDGMHITYIWGYSNTLPVAKIDNATYTQVVQALGTTPNLIDRGLTQTEEDLLRGISGAFVTTIDYKWGVGVISQTDPNGLKTTYEYDSFGRLKWVKDPDGNIINAYKYNYKGQ